MKNLLLALSLTLAIGAILTLNACKKTTSTEDDSVSAQDANTVMSAVNLTGDDGGSAAGQVTSFTGKTQGLYEALCGVTAIDSPQGQHSLTLTYNGGSYCFGIKRSGTITVALTSGTQWQNAGSVITITYNAFSVTDLLGNTYTLNGTHSITNVSGGFAWQIAYGVVTNTSATHNINANMSITFPNGSTRTWTVSRTRTWVAAGSTITITDEAQTTNGTGTDVTGTNRYGNSFTSSVLTPIMSDNNLSCVYLPYTGEVQHQVGSRTATVTYGTNSSGAAEGTPTVCGAGFFIQYENANNGKSASRFVAY